MLQYSVFYIFYLYEKRLLILEKLFIFTQFALIHIRDPSTQKNEAVYINKCENLKYYENSLENCLLRISNLANEK